MEIEAFPTDELLTLDVPKVPQVRTHQRAPYAPR
jgi:hypothetical protein